MCSKRRLDCCIMQLMQTNNWVNWNESQDHNNVQLLWNDFSKKQHNWIFKSFQRGLFSWMKLESCWKNGPRKDDKKDNAALPLPPPCSSSTFRNFVVTFLVSRFKDPQSPPPWSPKSDHMQRNFSNLFGITQEMIRFNLPLHILHV